MIVTIRPSTPEDIRHVIGEPLPWRVRALTGEIAGRVIAVGGLTWLPGGTIAAFAALTDEARKYKVSLHRAGLRLMREAKESGIKSVVASADSGSDPALRWLLRLGFKPVESDNERTTFVWRSE
jgi:N-acetylglutamate synthase-like GNAT family acetyltransferase